MLTELELALPYDRFERGLCNPSIAFSEGRIHGVARIKKSLQVPACVAISFELNADLEVSETAPVSWHSALPGPRPEDFRLFRFAGQMFASHTLVSKANKKRMIAISTFDPVANHMECLGIPRVAGYRPGRVEKNWCFFEQSGDLFCLISVVPEVVVARLVSMDRLEFEVCRRYSSTHLFQHMNQDRYISLSTAPLALDGIESLFMIHQSDLKIVETEALTKEEIGTESSVKLNKYTRRYRHYGVKMNRHDFAVRAVTAQPVLTRPEPQFPELGITFIMSGVRLGDEFIYGFGEDDRRGKLLSVNIADLSDFDWLSWQGDSMEPS